METQLRPVFFQHIYASVNFFFGFVEYNICFVDIQVQLLMAVSVVVAKVMALAVVGSVVAAAPVAVVGVAGGKYSMWRNILFKIVLTYVTNNSSNVKVDSFKVRLLLRILGFWKFIECCRELIYAMQNWLLNFFAA